MDQKLIRETDMQEGLYQKHSLKKKILYNKFQIAKKYLRYYFTASNGKGHGVHPPFLYSFIKDVLNDKKDYPAYLLVEQLRQQLLDNNHTITITDFGAGSATGAGQERTIASIAKNAAKPKKLAQLLFRIIQYYGCRNNLELGTSLGISSAYMALANSFGRVVTCEGSSAIATVARENFQKLFVQNITLLEGEFDQSFNLALQKMPLIDFLFIDGNHRELPTISYFEKAIPHLHEDSIIVVDDIHWSTGMENAWEKIKQHPAVSESVDLFFIGIIFLRKDQKAKQHFEIRF